MTTPFTEDLGGRIKDLAGIGAWGGGGGGNQRWGTRSMETVRRQPSEGERGRGGATVAFVVAVTMASGGRQWRCRGRRRRHGRNGVGGGGRGGFDADGRC